MNAQKTALLTLIALLFIFPSVAQDLSFTMEMISTKQKDPIIMKVASKGNKIALTPQVTGTQGQMKIIVDHGAKKQYMLMDANGQKMAMAMDLTDIEKAIEQSKDPKVTITKETKVIDGYKCTKVITETDETISEMWLTEDLGLNYGDLYKMVSSNKSPQGSNYGIPVMKNVKGFPVQMVITDKKKNEPMTVNIKNISKAKVEDKAFSMEGYQMMDMGNTKH